MTPYEIIEEIRNTSGTNDKRNILRINKDDKLFQKVLTNLFDPRITFGIKKIPNYTTTNENRELIWGIDSLKVLEDRISTGNDAIEYLGNVLSNLSVENAKVIEWIIAKDSKAGFGISLVNDEMAPYSVYETSYMGCLSYSEKRIDDLFKNHPFAYSEVKYDGRFLNTVIENDTVFFESRGGRPNPLIGALEKEALKFREVAGFDGVINGELMLSGVQDRYASNGIISSYISIAQKVFDGKDVTKETIKFEKEHGYSLVEVKELITLVVWDYVPIEDYRKGVSAEARSTRLVRLEEIINEAGVFDLVEYRIVNSKVEAIEHFQEMLARDEEGTILKGAFSEWKDGKHKGQIKMKLEIDLDLRIVGFNYGTPGTKNEHVISSLNVETECGLLKTSPGGIKEKDMAYITENMDTLLGKLVEVKCSGTSQDSEGNYSLLHPVFKIIRDDKDHGDTLESVIEIENGAKGLV